MTVEDAAESCAVALAKALELGFDTFVISANTPFSPEDCEELIVDAPSVVKRYFPEYPEIYRRLGWTMFQSIDRIYDSAKALQRLGFRCRVGFKENLEELQRLLDVGGDSAARRREGGTREHARTTTSDQSS